MESGTIEREVRIEASPEVVFDVISSPEHSGAGGAPRPRSSRLPAPPAN